MAKLINRQFRIHFNGRGTQRFKKYRSDTDKFIFKSWTGLRFPLAFGFSVSGEVEADHDSQPPPDTHRTDTTYRFKLGYDF